MEKSQNNHYDLNEAPFELDPEPLFDPASTPPLTDKQLAERVALFKSFFAQLTLEQDVYSHEDQIKLRWPRKLTAPANYIARLRHVDGRIFAEAEGEQGDKGDRTFIQALSIPDGDYEVILMPSANEYYNQGVRVEYRLPLTVVRTQFVTTPTHMDVTVQQRERTLELLRHAVAQNDGVFSEVGKMAVEWWTLVKPERVLAAIERINNEPTSHLQELVGLLALRTRFGMRHHFPKEVIESLDALLCGFDYQQPAASITDQLSLLSGELLARQHYSPDMLADGHRYGERYWDDVVETLVPLLQQISTHGFTDLSGDALAQMIVALCPLIDEANSESIWEIAAIVMDKLLATVALNAYQGVYGTDTLNGHGAPLAGVSRLLWGLGTWNQHIAAAVSLACCDNYVLPPVIAALGLDQSATTLTTERHGDMDDVRLDRVSYKTPDYLLSSIRNTGHWQATLGPDAIVSVSPLVNVVQSQVAQYNDCVISLFNIRHKTVDAPIQIQFPVAAFDDSQVRSHWAFAAKGDTYLAIASSQPIQRVSQGERAHRALQLSENASSQQVVLLCQLGHALDYGSFDNFRKQILGARLNFDGFSVRYRKLGGDNLAFGWDNYLTINDRAQPIATDNHYSGPNCSTDDWPASELLLVHGKQAVLLDLGEM
ncbi:MAG: hypothetical protein AAF639_44205 [Chloroflexota bacterium]